MYIWEEDKYKELTNLKHNNTDIEPLLPYATEFSFGTGDLFYMPWNKYHVGNTQDLSVGITLWFNNPSKYKYFNNIFDSFLTQYVKKENDIIENKFNLSHKDCSTRDILDILKLDNDIVNGSLEEFFSFLTNEFNYNLISNGGWQSTPLSQKDRINYNLENDYAKMIDCKIISNGNFTILYKINKDKLSIYVRGSKFEMLYFPILIDLINEINKGYIIDIKSFLNSKNTDIPIEAILYFIGLIYEKRGIEIKN